MMFQIVICNSDIRMQSSVPITRVQKCKIINLIIIVFVFIVFFEKCEQLIFRLLKPAASENEHEIIYSLSFGVVCCVLCVIDKFFY